MREQFPFQEAQDHFELFFAAAAGEFGLHAGAALAASSTTVWDATRLGRIHDALQHEGHRHQLRHLRDDVIPSLRAFAEVEPRHWEVALMTYTPRRWPDKLAAHLSRGARGGSLVGLALTGQPLLTAWIRRETLQREKACRALYRVGRFDACLELAVAKFEPTGLELLRFAAAAADRPSTREVVRFFEPIEREAKSRLNRSLAAYDRFLVERRRAKVVRMKAAPLSMMLEAAE